MTPVVSEGNEFNGSFEMNSPLFSSAVFQSLAEDVKTPSNHHSKSLAPNEAFVITGVKGAHPASAAIVKSA